ncbi:protein translocase subunit SecF [Candidatus Daviesbacteria bacterium]|nr:protein translocase subunit SecF [Candidatus Daviesbacteria bacterium]
MKFKIWYFIFSLLVIIPGLYYLFISGLRLGIDFTGGALLEYRFKQEINTQQLGDLLKQNKIEVSQIVSTQENTYIIKAKPLTQENIKDVKTALSSTYGEMEERRIENVGPTIGAEVSKKAVLALAISVLAIILYITYTFRKVPKPASSWRFGIATIIALVHDVLMVVGVFAILGHFWQVEVDTLFVTALLTIIGFSVHDTIVVFDRIRENLIKNIGQRFGDVANLSVIQTLARSLNTSLTLVFVLIAMVLFGGESLRWFVIAMLIGVISGTYSSIFNATAVLALWEEKLGH